MENPAHIYHITQSKFDDESWTEIVDRVSVLFNYTEKERKSLAKNALAKLIAAIPFLSGSREPRRVALSHLVVTILASHEAGKAVFLHSFQDNRDPLRRLERISHFDGGDAEIQERGMNLLAIVMLADHRKDSFEDHRSGKYNPLNSGVWKFDEMIRTLENRVISVPCPGMDDIMSAHEAKAIFWEFF